MKLLPLGVLLGIWLTSLLGCSSSTTMTSSPNPMAEIVKLVEQDKGRRLFQYSENGLGQEKEEQWSRVEAGSSEHRFHYTEIYNTYQMDAQTTEYYVQQFSFDGSDTTQRFVVKDFQFVAKGDSFSLSLSKEYEGRVVEELMVEAEGKQVKLYKIFGYAHVADPEPSHHKYWSPEIGSVLIWYGEERFLELVEPSYPFIQTLKNTITHN